MSERAAQIPEDTADLIGNSLRGSADVALRTLEECRAEIGKALDLLVETYSRGGKVLFCGNGGSAADAQHLAAELMIRLSHDLDRPALGAISLSTDPSNLTAGGNDIGFENVFARNVEGLGRTEDALVAISTSGRSPNILRAVEKATELGMRTVGLCGGDGGDLVELCDVTVVVPSYDVQRIQETHITIGHILCEGVERKLYSQE